MYVEVVNNLLLMTELGMWWVCGLGSSAPLQGSTPPHYVTGIGLVWPFTIVL